MLRFLMTPVLVMTMAVPAAADKLSLNQISRYLNGMTSAKGSFTQINDDGTISTGTIYIKRPGKVRFEYNPPDQAMVLASSGTVAVFDLKVKTAEQFPLNKTPLSIILARNVNLGQANMVTGHSFDGTATVVTAQDPKHPEYGNIQMKFTGNPVELRQWIINDDSGSTTTVVLGDLDTSTSLANSLFNLQRELSKIQR